MARIDISKLVAEINAKYSNKKKSRACFIPGIDNSMPTDVDFWLKTKCLPLNVILGQGLPGKRIIEIAGTEGSGKSTLLMFLLAGAQKDGFYTLIYEPESSNCIDRMNELGIDTSEIIIIEGEYLEEFLENTKFIVEKIKRKDPEAKFVIGWDSLATTDAKEIFESGFGEGRLAAMARAMSQNFGRFNRFIQKNDVIFIAINQLRDKVGVMYGEKDTTPGGRTLRFYACIRLKTRFMCRVKNDEGDIIGIRTKITCIKNKVFSPFKSCIISLDFNKGIKGMDSILYSLKEVISGGFSYDGKTYKGDNRIRELIKSDKGARKEALRLIQKHTI